MEDLLLVFAKNKRFGEVKTRLAATIGNESAFEVYTRLFHLTEAEAQKLSHTAVHIYYTHAIDREDWSFAGKYLQAGETLGDRMRAAFAHGFKQGYKRIVGIGTDLPEMSAEIIENALTELKQNDFVIGPAEDGGYYLVGMNAAKGLYIFNDKPWSTAALMDLTERDIIENDHSLLKLPVLNDIDTVGDLERSCIAQEFMVEIKKAQQ